MSLARDFTGITTIAELRQAISAVQSHLRGGLPASTRSTGLPTTPDPQPRPATSGGTFYDINGLHSESTGGQDSADLGYSNLKYDQASVRQIASRSARVDATTLAQVRERRARYTGRVVDDLFAGTVSQVLNGRWPYATYNAAIIYILLRPYANNPSAGGVRLYRRESVVRFRAEGLELNSDARGWTNLTAPGIDLRARYTRHISGAITVRLDNPELSFDETIDAAMETVGGVGELYPEQPTVGVESSYLYYYPTL